MSDATSKIPPAALALGLAGLVPFYASAAAGLSAQPDIARIGLISFALYAAVILSFLGGARWGLELARAPDAPSTARLVYSVAPSLAGWAIAGWMMLAPGAHGPAGLFAGCFAAQYVWDRTAGREGLAPNWYPALRQILTAGVIIACLALPLARVVGR